MMKLERKTHRDGNLHPKAFNCLNLLPENFTYHKDHIERHPFSIYSLSLQNVMQSFQAVLDEIDLISTALFNADGRLDHPLDRLPDLQRELLYALHSHIEDCYRILKVIHPFDNNGKEKSVDSWLQKVKHPGYKNFYPEIKDYRNSFALIVNKIKHNGGQLRPIMMYSEEHNIVARTVKKGIQTFPRDARIVGYFLEGMQPDGCIGPDCDVHPDGKTAISLNRDLRYHFANVYRVGHHLRSAIATTVNKLHGEKLPPDAPVDTTSSYNMELIAERVSKLLPLFFPNEFFKKTPDVKFHRHNKNADLILEVPGSQYMAWDGEVRICYNQQMDAVCLNYRMPYWN
jgi:hypothetical protein